MVPSEIERQVKDLSELLRATFLPVLHREDVSIEAFINRWHCSARIADRMVLILCSSVGTYSVIFKTNDKTVAKGCPYLERNLISAISSWLEGHSLDELYALYEFVDRDKRYLEQFRKEAIRLFPELGSLTTITLQQLYDDSYELKFAAGDRSCRLQFHCEWLFPACEFDWDDTCLFAVQATHTTPLSLLLKRWLCDDAMPSSLKQEFDWLEVGKLAKYYEDGRGIEGEFILSWDQTEQFYRSAGHSLSLPYRSEILEMITDMRGKGYDRTLRAGHSVFDLVVSRSRRYCLRREQPAIFFYFSQDGGINIYVCEGQRKLVCSHIELTPLIDDLLKELELRDID
ncbi:MAG TPA: hypothetical protein V6C78_12925 [Crinalium sp.]|jgi:hypothetical protein